MTQEEEGGGIRRQRDNIFKVYHGKSRVAAILYSPKLPCESEGEIKTFPDQQKLRDYIDSPLPPKITEVVVQAESKGLQVEIHIHANKPEHVYK